MTEIDDESVEDDVTQDEDWVLLGSSTAGVDFDAYACVDQELATCGEVEIGSCVEEEQGGGGYDGDKAEPEPVPSFTEALRAFESMRAFLYALDITERNIVKIESLLFSLKRKTATKQMKIRDIFKKK